MIYLDNSATTRVDDEVIAIMNKYHTEEYFNPSSLHKFSLAVSKDIRTAKDNLAKKIGCLGSELTFVSCGSEANNTAILGCLRSKRGNIVVSDGEHASVSATVASLASKGYEIRKFSLFDDGRINVDSLVSLIDDNTLLVCAMLVNNETGAINDVKSAVKRVKAVNSNALFMCDGVQAVGKIPLNVKDLGVDLFTFSGHKLHASKGIACLCARSGVTVNPLIYGGGQQNGVRSGTEYVAGIMGFCHAVSVAIANLAENNERYRLFGEEVKQTCEKIGDYKLICASNAPAIMCIAFAGIKSQVLQNLLEQDDIVIGLGSACNSKKGHSTVMDAIKLEQKYLDGVVRISFSKYVTADDISIFCNALTKYVKLLRGSK